VVPPSDYDCIISFIWHMSLLGIIQS
jgi:hypothetical protein